VSLTILSPEPLTRSHELFFKVNEAGGIYFTDLCVQIPYSCGREWEKLKGNLGDSFRVIRVIDSSSYFILDHPATDTEQTEP
jgi:hypothetical protein